MSQQSYAYRSQDLRGSVFASIVVVLFILTMIGMSGVLYWEKEKITQQYVSKTDSLQKEKILLKEQIFKLEKEKDKSVYTAEALQIKCDELLAEKETTVKNNALIEGLQKVIVDEFNGIKQQNATGWSKVDVLNRKLDRLDMSSVSAAVKAKATSSRDKDKTADADIPPVVVTNSSNPSGGSDDVYNKNKYMHIVSVNREHNFAVINKGLVDGVQIGEQFVVMRDDTAVATLEISELRDFVSLGIIKGQSGDTNIGEGDTVIRK